jgi:hypothetical protein
MPAIPLSEGQEFGGANTNPLAGLDLPQSEYLPEEYSQRMFGQLQLGQERAEKEQRSQFLEGINAMGRLYTGSALKEGITSLLGPALERQQGLLGNIALQGLEARRGERLTGEERAFQSEQSALDRALKERQLEQDREEFFERLAATERVGERERAAARKASRFSTRLGGELESGAIGAIKKGIGSAVSSLPGLF